MNRKIFLTIAMAFVLAGCAGTLLISCNSTKGKNIGLQLYSIRDSINRDVPAAIEKVSAMGYTFLELAGYSDGKFYNMEPAAFKALCEANGMPVLSSHTSRELPNSENYAETMEWWDNCIDAHIAVGARYIVQATIGRSSYTSIENLKKWCDYFNEVGAKCNAKGIRFGFHNHNREFSTVHGDTVMYDFMLQNTDPEKVFFEIDLYWCVVGGADPVDYFNKYPGRFELWHIKDKEEIGASGMMDFESIWAGMEKSGMKYGIMEVERYNFDQFTSCQKSIDFLNAAEYIVLPKK